ncbi:MAG: aminotransferase class I/II-fold pyridoxal phosphate-dependent enzyme [Vallitaleaceae bacterium]|jgi:histidinol-phosphate/aromatic aminotransferase/cobyric acid decarboxylase-like protein/choline kinase|nr:aminotransferase class I/II-fold pyridoxal phosphate-dependent enzyme [Vallitaleaceae bacterium]
MQAIILAAGMGKRLKDLTKDSAKCMVKVDGITLIERMLSQLDKLNLSGIIIVVGYKAEKLISFISKLEVQTRITFVTNEIYYKTNNIYSLYLAKDYLLKEDTLLLESDLIFADTALHNIINNPYPNLALVAKYESWMDGTVITLDEGKNIISFIGKMQYDYNDVNEYYKTVNIYKFSKHFSNTHYVPFLQAYIKSQGTNAYYEQVLKVIGLLDKPEIKAVMLENVVWYEIDDAQDLDIAESLFSASPKDRLEKIQNRYGGYWRYSNLIDFCYLVNPFYPPTKMIDEIKFNVESLICHYPSGLGVNSLLAAKCFGLKNEHLCVGNGAAELINSLMKTLKGKIGVIRPTFEEYPNRMDQDCIVPYYPKNQDFSYTIDDLMAYYEDLDISTLLLINPDNPSGNFIELVDVLILAKWTMKKGIRLIVDESFVDFANSEFSTTLLSEKILQDYKELVVVKSISKSYGIPGLRLGIISSADTELIKFIKNDVSIWNINSIAEFYMQICEKYSDEYKYSLEFIKEAREEFLEQLGEIESLRVIPTQANYVMCEILGKYSATQLTESLLVDFNILIKDLSMKNGISGQYIRIAIKRKKENEILVSAFHKLFSDKKSL